MKNWILAAVAAATMASCQQSPTVVVPESGVRIAYVRIDSLQNQYTYFQELSAELAEEESKIGAELSRRQQAFQENVALYQQELPKMTPAQRQANEQDLQRVQQQYLQVEQAAQEQLYRKQTELGNKLKAAMDEASAQLREEMNLDFILIYEVGGQILSANEELDITAEMVKLLNKDAVEKEEVTDSTSNS